MLMCMCVCVCVWGGGAVVECVLVVGSMCGVCVDVQLESMCVCVCGGGGGNVRMNTCEWNYNRLMLFIL